MNKLNRNITTYYLYIFFSAMFFGGAILIPFFKNWGGLNQAEIQTLESIFWFAVLFMEIPTGFIADLFSRKTSLILGALFWVIGIIMYVSSPTFLTFAAGEITLAIGVAFISGANQALIYDTLKSHNQEDRAKKVISRSESVSMLGFVFGNLIGAILAQFVGLEIVFLLSIIPQILAVLVAFFLKEPKIETKEETKRYSDILTVGIKTVTHSSRIRFLALDLIFISTLCYFVIWFYQAKLDILGLPLIVFGIFSVILPLFESIVLQLQEKLEKLLGGEQNFLKYSLLPVAIGFLAAGIINHWVGVLILILLTGGFGLTRRPYYIAILNKSIGSENRATSISTISMLRGIVIAIANPFFGLLADQDLNFTFIVLAGLTGVGYLISSRAVRKL